MEKLAIAFMLAISLSGCFGGAQEKRAYDFVISELQEKKGLFKDQYEISMPLDNSRGSVVVVEITDEEVDRKAGFDPHFVYILKKDQRDQVGYVSRYSVVFLKEEPNDEKIEELAREEGLI